MRVSGGRTRELSASHSHRRRCSDFDRPHREEACLYIIAGNVFNQIDGGKGVHAKGLTQENADPVVRAMSFRSRTAAVS
jgi:hypothetical protein